MADIYMALFFVHILLVFGGFFIMLFNIITRRLYDFPMGVLIYGISSLGWFLGLLVATIDFDILIYAFIIKLSSYIWLLSLALVFIEIFINYKDKILPKGRYKSDAE